MQRSYLDKKILILGGKPIGSVEAVKYAQQKRIYTIVTDNLPVEESPAKQISDENWDISTADVDLLCAKIIENNIDAVFTGIHEFNIWKTSEICDRLNLPFYATPEQLIKTSIKSEYKQLFREYNIPVIQEFDLNENTFEEDISKVDYPVLIKPIDGSGGYGISICYDKEELVEAYQKALTYSKVKKVLVEKYIIAKEVTVFYIIKDGKIMLSTLADRHTKNGNKYTIALPVLYIFPSIHLTRYLETLNEKVIIALKSLGLKNGMVFIQSFVDTEGFKFYDIGFRLTGTQEYYITEHICNYNALKMMLDYALTEKMGQQDLENLIDPFLYGKSACNITFLAKPSVIGKFIGIEEIERRPEVIKVIRNHQPGDTIPDSAIGTLNQVILRVFIVAETKSQLKEIIKEITASIDVLSDKEETILLPTFNIDEL